MQKQTKTLWIKMAMELSIGTERFDFFSHARSVFDQSPLEGSKASDQSESRTSSNSADSGQSGQAKKGEKSGRRVKRKVNRHERRDRSGNDLTAAERAKGPFRKGKKRNFRRKWPYF